MCQLQHLEELGAKDSLLDSSLESLRLNVRLLKKKLRALKNNFNPQDQQPAKAKATIKVAAPSFNAGELVKVRPLDFIRNLLDVQSKYRGCPFMPEMADYCGKTYEVYKEVHYFYDEIKQKLCRCHDMVILKGASCSGKKRFYLRRCDLNCPFFWHKDWLEQT